jgi:hypothetical protein
MVRLGLGVADRLQLAKFCATLSVPEVLPEPQRPTQRQPQRERQEDSPRVPSSWGCCMWTLTAIRRA